MPSDNYVSSFIGCSILPIIGKKTNSILFNDSEFMGIEAELEQCSDHIFTKALGPLMESVVDSSLKLNGVEVRFKSALNGSNILKALNELTKAVEISGVSPYTDGNRGSTHIHCNVSDMSVNCLHNFILLSYFCEPILMDMCSRDRRHNAFSINVDRTKDHKKVLKQVDNKQLDFSDSIYKYRAIGLNSIFNKGSLEFRMFNATTDTTKIVKWVNIVQQLKHLANTMVSAEQYIKDMANKDLREEVNVLFGRNMNLSERAYRTMWDLVRDLVFNEDSGLPMENKFSDFYRHINS